jgi:hypothetical protein
MSAKRWFAILTALAMNYLSSAGYTLGQRILPLSQ